uniref:Uncharacterized protein n=1 Tax=Panagrolaimus sp. JU765 TaxID=591449 RepID=A0AC34QP90_9BILA
MLPVLLGILTLITIICIAICIRLLKQHKKRENTPPVLQQPRIPRMILTTTLDNDRTALQIHSGQMPLFKTIYDPPPPYELHPAPDWVAPPQPEDLTPPPPSYDEILPGAILPSSSIRFQPPAIASSLPKKR